MVGDRKLEKTKFKLEALYKEYGTSKANSMKSIVESPLFVIFIILESMENA